MGASNVNTTLVKLKTIGTNKYGDKMGYFTGVAKAAQNDTITIVGINKLVQVVSLYQVAAGVWETFTVSGKKITCAHATGSTTINGVVIYR